MNAEVDAPKPRGSYYYYRRRGLCGSCGKVPPQPDRVNCGPCAERLAASLRARTARLRAAGLCATCGKPSGKFRMCRDCRLARSAYQRERREADPRCRECQQRPQRSRWGAFCSQRCAAAWAVAACAHQN